jgi:peptide/nickel transport system ATP-binding protein
VTVQYRTERSVRIAADNISLSIPSTGYTLGVVGESGSGKTTLGLSMMNLIEPPGEIAHGAIEFDGRNVLKMSAKELRHYRWQQVSMVYQSAMNSLNPVKTISSHIIEVFREHNADISKSEARDKAIKLLTSVGIKEDRTDAYSHELSGGMRQRAVIAMALALSPKLLIADEPTSALDVVVQKQILALLRKEVIEKGLSLVFITHEIALLGDLVDNVAVMFAGEIVERGDIDDVLFNPLHPYTEMLLESLLSLGSTRDMIRSTKALDAGERAIPEVGCKFANRCKYAFGRCRVERPILKEKQNGRFVACHKQDSSN